MGNKYARFSKAKLINQCIGGRGQPKVKYVSKVQAEEAIDQCRKTKMKVKPIRCYCCQICGYWHITHTQKLHSKDHDEHRD